MLTKCLAKLFACRAILDKHFGPSCFCLQSNPCQAFSVKPFLLAEQSLLSIFGKQKPPLVHRHVRPPPRALSFSCLPDSIVLKALRQTHPTSIFAALLPLYRHSPGSLPKVESGENNVATPFLDCPKKVHLISFLLAEPLI